MNKILRLSLIAVLAFVFNGAFAQTTFNFDNDYATLFPTLAGVSTSSSHDGDITEDLTATDSESGISITVSAKTSGNNANRIWSGSPRLRMYSGTLTIAAPAGKNIASISYNAGKWNSGNTVDAGTLTTSGTSGSWEGSANTVVLTIAGNTQFKSIDVTLEGEKVIDITNTPETAYTVAEANELIEAGKGLATSVYVKGYITAIDSVSLTYGNAVYSINDTKGSTEGQLKVFRGYYLEGAKFSSENQIAVGDEVIVYGQLTNYNGTYEINSSNKLYSLNGATTGITSISSDKLNVNAPVYNLAGQRVSRNAKGLLIQNGKKFINK